MIGKGRVQKEQVTRQMYSKIAVWMGQWKI